LSDISNVKMGVCSVTFGTTALGHTKGGVTVTYEPDIHDITVDQYGSTPAEKVLIGQKLKATVPLAESSIANLAIAIPEGEAGAESIKIGGKVGLRLSSEAETLVLHPIANDSDDLSEDVVIYKAIVTNSIEIPFKVDEERVIELEFEGLVDETRDDGDMLGLIGNSGA
jgi:hypothetical protein